MKMRFGSLALLAAAAAIPCAASAGVFPTIPAGPAKPVFTSIHHDGINLPSGQPASQLTQWNGGFTDQNGTARTFVQIGTDPGSTNTSTTTTVLIIPIKMMITSGGKTYKFDPMKFKPANANGLTVVQSLMASPLFNSGVDFTSGGVDLGNTQYIDAFQRGNFWNAKVKSESGYHVLFQTKLEKEVTIKLPNGTVEQNEFVSQKDLVGLMDINAFDTQLQTFMKANKDVNPGVLPLFVTYNIFLTEGGCCIGGYHGANGRQPSGQTYSYATYVDMAGSFSQDVSAFSHELGEWEDDPFTDNVVGCQDNSIMEVGDPIEREANYGGYPYPLNGFTYNLQSLSYIDYFGDSRKIPVGKQWSFQGSKDTDAQHYCPGQ